MNVTQRATLTCSLLGAERFLVLPSFSSNFHGAGNVELTTTRRSGSPPSP